MIDTTKYDISVVLPTMNEPAVAKVISRIYKTLGKNIEILVIDKSSDRTAEKARRAGARVVHQVGIGYGDAYIQGFKEAKGEYIVMLDADNTYLPEEIPRILKPVLEGQADMVMGNRFANMKEGAMSLRNKIGNKFLTWFLNRLYPIHIHDSQSGMRAFRKDDINSLGLAEAGMPLASEMVIKAASKGLLIKEVPITYEIRHGEAKQNVKNGFLIAGMTVRLMRDHNPLTLFGGISAILFIIGVMIGLSVYIDFLNIGTLIAPGRALLSILFVMSSIMFFGFALMIDLMVKELRKNGRR
ncbi:MAG: glycosyltransferase [Nanoarchaeota archaeon]|nr:glycosyltransferase [Nanoarchaeota archaeon]